MTINLQQHRLRKYGGSGAEYGGSTLAVATRAKSDTHGTGGQGPVMARMADPAKRFVWRVWHRLWRAWKWRAFLRRDWPRRFLCGTRTGTGGRAGGGDSYGGSNQDDSYGGPGTGSGGRGGGGRSFGGSGQDGSYGGSSQDDSYGGLGTGFWERGSGGRSYGGSGQDDSYDGSGTGTGARGSGGRSTADPIEMTLLAVLSRRFIWRIRHRLWS